MLWIIFKYIRVYSSKDLHNESLISILFRVLVIPHYNDTLPLLIVEELQKM